METTEHFGTMLTRIRTLRMGLNNAKNEKLRVRWERYGDYRGYSLDRRIKDLHGEFYELAEALAYNDPPKILDEVVDVTNNLEFIYDVLELWKC